jgi:hypothetical protein
MVEVDNVNGGVGLETPNLTGAIKLSAVSQSSSTAILSRDWKTRLLFTKGAETPLILQTNRTFFLSIHNYFY